MAVMFVNPSTGDYFHSTGLLDLDIHEGTNVALAKITDIRTAVTDAVIGLNITLALVAGQHRADGRRPRGGFRHPDRGDVRRDRRHLHPVRPVAAQLPDRQRRHRRRRARPLRLTQRRARLRPYVYTDTDGNRYRLGHGLALDVCRGVESADPVDSGAELGLRRRQGQPARHDQLGQRTGVQPPT
ncbi:MAG TPA: hypothetical protein VIT65_04940 [Microlunatus sp.]